MATLDLSRASSGFDMTAANLVTFGSVVGTRTATSWSYLTPAGNRVTVTGTSMQFDASGRPTAGSVTAVDIDIANDGDADISFTGLSEGAFPFGIAVMQGSPDAFWRMLLEGNDVILGPEKAKGAPQFVLVLHCRRRRRGGARHQRGRPRHHPARRHRRRGGRRCGERRRSGHDRDLDLHRRQR